MKLPRLLFASSATRARAETAIADGTAARGTYDTIMPATIMPESLAAGRPSSAAPRVIAPNDPATQRRRSPGAAEPSARFGGFLTALPWIGGMPFRKQVQILVPALAVSVLLAFVVIWIDARQAGNAALLDRIVGDALTHSQRLGKSAPGAVAGHPDAARHLRESREAMRAALAMLHGADDPVTGRSASVPSVAAADVARLDEMWKSTELSTAKLIDHEKLLQSLGAARRAINDSNKPLLDAAQTVALRKVQSDAGVREVSAAGDLVMLTQKIAKDVNQLVLGESINVEAANSLASDIGQFRELVETLSSGNERLRIPPAQDADSRRALGEIRKVLARIDQPLSLLGRELPKIVEAKGGEVAIFRDSETLRGQLGTIQKRLAEHYSGRSLNLWAVVLLGLIATLSVVGLVQAYLGDSRARTEEAERERGEAERLEREAKRTNDQNQAAILRLMNELQEVADGDLTVQATVTEDITGAIADSVNYTVEELRSLVSRINATATLVDEASLKAQMIASSLQVASEQQSREIRDTGEAVLRMAQQINDVSARASEAANVARTSLGASEHGAAAVQNAITGMNGIRDQIQETAKRIKRLGESSQEIGEIVELISDLTEQTNVLALNAAIQAASAGEAGRGFTIVAEEVQGLAERSALATKQIAALIKAIQTDTQDAVAAMERSTQGVVEGTRLSDEAGHALGDIGRVSTRLAELIEGFSNTTSKQAASAGTVAQAIQRILLVTEQTSEGTLQTAGSIRQLSALAQELKSSVSRFKVA